jgi:hypothetical protein
LTANEKSHQDVSAVEQDFDIEVIACAWLWCSSDGKFDIALA